MAKMAKQIRVIEIHGAEYRYNAVSARATPEVRIDDDDGG